MEAEMAAVNRAEKAEAPEVMAAAAPEREIFLKERYCLLMDVQLPGYDSPTAKAYAVKDKVNPAVPLFAHVCANGLPLNWKFLEHQRQQNIPGVLKLVEEAVVALPSAKGECPVLIYEKPGDPLLSLITGPMTVKEIEVTILVPVAETLRGLEERDVTHRGIRPENLFLSENKDGAGVLLGDSVSSPSAYNQPVLFEAIESALANPAGRGQGGISDDIYALGVTVLALLLGESPMKDANSETILNEKIKQGSYDFLTSGLPAAFLPPRMREFLKGVLHDDREKRWGLEQLECWLDAYRTQNLPTIPCSERHVFTFRKEQYITGRALARAFLQHPQEGSRILRESRFESWAARSLTNPEIARVVAEEIVKNRAVPIPAEQLVARIAILLDPDAPIRYKGFAAPLDGFGNLLASESANEKMRRNFSDIIRFHLPQLWLSARGLEVEENRKALQRLHRLQHLLNHRGFGCGFARCLYDLVPGLPCQSTLILPKYCATISELLPALEAKAGELDKFVEPMDPHIAAFIASRFSANIDSFLFSLASPQGSSERVLGILGLLASLQDRYGPARLTQLTGWLWKLLPPIIASYHNQALRRRLGQEAEQIAAKGSLVKIYNLVGNPAQRQKDRHAHGVARNQFTRSLVETAQINRKLKGLPLTSLVFGRLIASRISILIALVAVSFVLSKYI